MADSGLDSIFDVFNKLQEKLSSTASSSHQFDLPQLNQLNDMVYEVHRPPRGERPELEVVFFHGLQFRDGEHAYATTWMSRDNSQLWLQTWLAELFPKARIFTIAYDSSTRRTQEGGRLDMYCTGENLVSSLTSDGVQIGQARCPVVLVGHCLGGLVLKELCVKAPRMVGQKNEQRLDVQRIRNLLSNLRGMFFYGTPHNGSLLGDEFRNFCKGALVGEIETLNASSTRRNEDFNKLKLKYGWITAGIGESCQTYVESIGKKIHVVPEASSSPYMDNYYSEAANHYDICKPERKNAKALVLLENFLNKIKYDGVLIAKARADANSSPGYMIDLEGRAHKVRSILEEPDTNTIFIVGLSGIGKTTLAQQVLHDICDKFSATCFVSLDSLERPSNCEEQVLTKILKALDLGSNHNFSEVPHLLESRKVLIVLDNVDSQYQIRVLRPETWLEGSASKLIVTTTQVELGRSSKTFAKSSKTFVVPPFSNVEALELFRHYAFDGGQEPEDVRHLVSLVIKESENFPLCLEILGGYIKVNKGDPCDKQLWLELLDRLRKANHEAVDDNRLVAKLRFCCETLPAPERAIFLDIATIFHGCPLHWVRCIWKGCRDSHYSAWGNLQRRFLAFEDRRGTIRMHRLVRNLGQTIACPQNLSADKHTHISTSSVAKKLIREHQRNVDALSLKLHVRQSEIFQLENTTFANYARLEYLILEGVTTSSRTMELPRSLVYLRWKGALFTSCPVDFERLEKLVVLELIDCKSMKSLPHGVTKATKLTWLDLTGCASLTKLPSGLSTDLQHLGLHRTSLNNLPSDLEKFTTLNKLRAHRTKLTGVPRGVGSLKELSLLDLSGSRVTSLPDSIGDLKQLTKLDLTDTMVTSLPESIGRLESLTVLKLSYTCLKSLPESLGDLLNLERLFLNGTGLETLPDSLCKLRCLSHLDLDDTEISRLPDAMGQLVALERLCVSCPRLKVWSEATSSLSRLKFLIVNVGTLCESKHLLSSESQPGIHALLVQLPLLPALCDLHLHGRGYPQHLLQPLFDALQKMRALEYLTLFGFNRVEVIPCQLGNLTRLKRLAMDSLERLRELPESLGQLHSLTKLELVKIPRLCKLPDAFIALPLLSVLVVVGCSSLQSIPDPSNHVIYLESESSQARNYQLFNSRERNLRDRVRPFNRVVPSESESSQGKPLDSPKPILLLRSVVSDSWSILEHFLDGWGKHRSRRLKYLVGCSEMEKMRTKGFKREGGLFLDIKDAMQLFPEIDLHSLGVHGLPGRHSSPRWHAPDLTIRCDETHHGGFHSGVRVVSQDNQRSNSDETADLDSDIDYLDDQETDTETRKVSFLLILALSLGVVYYAFYQFAGITVFWLEITVWMILLYLYCTVGRWSVKLGCQLFLTIFLFYALKWKFVGRERGLFPTTFFM